MDKITGNFLTQAGKDFPLDCETLDCLQQLAAVSSVIGNVAGDKAVLLGCEPSMDGTRREEGYVFLRTRDFPQGEVLRWEGGPTTSGMYLRLEDIPVNADNTDYPKAYTRRTLAPGIGAESYRWEDFADIADIRGLMEENASLRGEMERMRPAPLGIVEMWAGSEVPDGYLLCDGRALRVADYPALHAAIGTAFNNAPDASGNPYTTTSGMFRLPDLRGRFIVGRHDSDNDYKGLGSAGGKKGVALAETEIPAHSHTFKDFLMIPKGSGECNAGMWAVGNETMQAGFDAVWNNPKRCDTGNDNRGFIQWLLHTTMPTGGGAAHENRPPYYVLAYIMRAG